MPGDHEISAHALELAVHGRPEPTVTRAGGKGWRTLVATKGWKTASGAGSANIPKEATAAYVGHARPGAERADAVDRMVEYYMVSRRIYWLAEPDSIIYAGKIESCDAATVHLGERLGIAALIDLGRRQLRESAERSCLMRAVLRSDHLAPNPKSSGDDRARYQRAIDRNLGKLIVCRAGCRSWGSVLHVESPMTAVARAIFSGKAPVLDSARVGQIDGHSTTSRIVAFLWPIFREAFEEARRMTIAELVESAVRTWSPARGPFQYIGWADGSRLCVMGRDEDGFVDEDTNSNTPAIMVFGVLGGRMVALPEWPAPNSGRNHIRQENTAGDVDLAPDLRSLTLLHSHAGRERANLGGRDFWRTTLELPPPGERVFHLLSEPGKPWHSLLAAAPPEEPPIVVDDPPDPNDETHDEQPPKPVEPKPRKKSLWQRLKDWWEGRKRK